MRQHQTSPLIVVPLVEPAAKPSVRVMSSLRLSHERRGADRNCNCRPRSRTVRALVDQMGERVFPYLKLDKCWKPRVVAALRAQEPDDHDPGKEKRYKTALENLRKQHLWGDVSDEKYQIEKAGLERQLKLAAPPSRPPQLPNLERAAELLEELPPLWLHEGVTDEQREAILQEVFTESPSMVRSLPVLNRTRPTFHCSRRCSRINKWGIVRWSLPRLHVVKSGDWRFLTLIH